MLRGLLVLILVPCAAVVLWLGLGADAERADFVLTTVEPRTLDPHRVSWLPEIQLSAAMFEGLTRLNDVTFQPEPAVADAWTVSTDGLTYTFRLRPTARWSNGDPVVAEDFRFGWLRVLHPACEAQYASLMFVIADAEDYYRSRLDSDPTNDLPDDAVGISAVAPDTFRVTLANPCSYFLDLTAFITFAPVHPPTLREWAFRDGVVLRSTQHLWMRPEHIVCNGPFILTRWEFKRSIWLRRNPSYWDPDSIHIRTIEAYSVTNPNAALIAYQTGRVDLVRDIERSVAQVLLAERQAGQRHDFDTGERFATFFYRVNCRRPPLDDPRVRQALSLAIDRQAICEHVMTLGEQPADTFVPRPTLRLMPRPTPDGRTVYYDPPSGLTAGLSTEARIARARELLAAAGYADPSQLRPIEIAYPSTDPEQRAVAEAVQVMWESALGITVNLRVLEGKVLSTRIRDLDYDVARSNWFGDYMDPSTFLDMFTTDSGQNRTGWSNAEYDRLIAAAAGEPDNERRFALFRAAEHILCTTEVPIFPVFYRRGSYLLNPRFDNLHDNPRDLLQIHHVRPVTPP